MSGPEMGRRRDVRGGGRSGGRLDAGKQLSVKMKKGGLSRGFEGSKGSGGFIDSGELLVRRNRAC